MNITDKQIVNFHKKYTKAEGCWNWQASVMKGRMGYGAFGIGTFEEGYKTIAAHRLAWHLANGAIPDGMCVLHRCDNPRCVNPAHLFLGAYADNNLDMRLKGRAAKKLDAGKVRQIRDSTLPTRALARIHGVSQHMICRVKHRIAWAHIE